MDTPRTHRRSWHNEGEVHCLTFSTFQCKRFFPGQHAATWFLQTLAEARVACPFHLFAYVIMPDHVHLVLRPAKDVTMRKVLWHLKRPMTKRVLDWTRKYTPRDFSQMAREHPTRKLTYHFWQQGGGYDRNLRSPSDVHEKIRYVHLNPVRKGLVEQPEEWPYSSAGEWILGETGAVPIDWDHVPDPELKR